MARAWRSQFDDLESDPPADRLFLFSHVDHATTAFADFLEQFVAADTIPWPLGGGGQECSAVGTRRRLMGIGSDGRSFEEIPDALVFLDEYFDALAKSGIPSAGFLQPDRAFARLLDLNGCQE
jgi:hypothetical protein